MIHPPHRRLAAVIAATVTTTLALTLTPPPALAGPTAGCHPTQANGYSVPAGISANGRYALFLSQASNLVPGGQPGWHLYLRDLTGCRTELVDATVTGDVPDTGVAFDPTLNTDGRYAVFASSAAGLVSGGTGGTSQAYLRNLPARTTELISVAHDGSPGDGVSWPAGVSANGRYVLFVSQATNLIPGGVPNYRNVYVRDRWQATTRLVATIAPNSIAPAWVPRVSPDGEFLTIDTVPTRPPGEWRWQTHLVNHVDPSSQLVGVAIDGGWPNDSTYGAGISAGGRFVLFNSGASDLVPDDTNGATDAFVRDTVAGRTVRVSVGDDGSQASDGAFGGGISATGRWVAFSSGSADLVPGDTNNIQDVFVRDLLADTTVRASVGHGGAQSNGESDSAKISAGGRFVIFRSDATNLVPNDTNGVGDVFVRDLRAGTTVRISVG